MILSNPKINARHCHLSLWWYGRRY